MPAADSIPKASRADTPNNRAQLERAGEKLTRLFRQAADQGAYAKLQIEVVFQRGNAELVNSYLYDAVP